MLFIKTPSELNMILTADLPRPGGGEEAGHLGQSLKNMSGIADRLNWEIRCRGGDGSLGCVRRAEFEKAWNVPLKGTHRALDSGGVIL